MSESVFTSAWEPETCVSCFVSSDLPSSVSASPAFQDSKSGSEWRVAWSQLPVKGVSVAHGSGSMSISSPDDATLQVIGLQLRSSKVRYTFLLNQRPGIHRSDRPRRPMTECDRARRGSSWPHSPQPSLHLGPSGTIWDDDAPSIPPSSASAAHSCVCDLVSRSREGTSRLLAIPGR